MCESPTGRIQVTKPPLQQIPRPLHPIIQEFIDRYEDAYDELIEILKEAYRDERLA